MNKDFTIIVQGPLHETSLDNLKNYLEVADVVVSAWQGDDLSILDKYSFDGEVSVLLNSLDPKYPDAYDKWNI